MAQSVGVLDITFPASGDLSAKQYCFVTLDSNGQVAACGANGKAIGILQNKPDAQGEAARVRVLGTSKLKVAEACARGKFLTSTAAGLGEVADNAGEFCGAIALEAATAANDIIEALIVHFTAHASDA